MNEGALAKRDMMYCDYNQTETENQEILEERGHPNAREYRILRDFFDSLQHFANSNARFYSYETGDENTQYWAPKLRVRETLYAGGRPIFPCDGKEYLQMLKEIDISAHDPYLDAGNWLINTRDEDFFGAIKSLERVKNIRVSVESHDRHDHFTARIYLDNVEQFQIVRKIVDEHVNPLPREDGDKAIKQALKARSENWEHKPIYLANVREVTEREHAVLVPLIPLGKSWTTHLAATIVYDLHELGYDAKTIRHYSNLARENSIKSIVEYVEAHGRFTPPGKERR